MTSTPRNLLRANVEVGDEVQVLANGQCVLRTRVQGVDPDDSKKPDKPFAFLAEPDVTKAQVPIGSEIWISR